MYPTPQLTRDRGGSWRYRGVRGAADTCNEGTSPKPYAVARDKTDSIYLDHLSRADRGAPSVVCTTYSQDFLYTVFPLP